MDDRTYEVMCTGMEMSGRQIQYTFVNVSEDYSQFALMGEKGTFVVGNTYTVKIEDS